MLHALNEFVPDALADLAGVVRAFELEPVDRSALGVEDVSLVVQAIVLRLLGFNLLEQLHHLFLDDQPHLLSLNLLSEFLRQ